MKRQEKTNAREKEEREGFYRVSRRLNIFPFYPEASRRSIILSGDYDREKKD